MSLMKWRDRFGPARKLALKPSTARESGVAGGSSRGCEAVFRVSSGASQAMAAGQEQEPLDAAKQREDCSTAAQGPTERAEQLNSGGQGRG